MLYEEKALSTGTVGREFTALRSALPWSALAGGTGLKREEMVLYLCVIKFVNFVKCLLLAILEDNPVQGPRGLPSIR